MKYPTYELPSSHNGLFPNPPPPFFFSPLPQRSENDLLIYIPLTAINPTLPYLTYNLHQSHLSHPPYLPTSYPENIGRFIIF